MAERSTISQVVQVGVEAVPGTPVAATKQLLALSLSPAVQLDVNQFQPKGGKYPTIVYAGREWAQSSVAGDATYSELQYALSSVVTTPTIAQLLAGAVPTGAYRWLFSPRSFGADAPKTLTVEEGDLVRAHRSSNFILTSFDLNFDRKGVTLGGSAYGTAIEDGITMTPNPVSIPTIPVQPSQVDVFMDDTSAGLGATKLTRALKGQFHITDRYNPLFVVDSAQPSFVAHTETDPNPTFKVTVEANAQGMAMLTALRLGQTKFLRWRATGPKIYDDGGSGAANVYHRLTVDMAGKVSAVSAFSDQDGVYAIEFTFAMVHDAGWGKPYEVELINGQATL